MTTPALAEHLTAALTSVLADHMARAKTWYPHDYVPWEMGADREDPSRALLLPEPVRVAVVLNLLTEDNLPGYHRELSRAFGTDGAWRTWTDRWTAEEGRHALAIRDYLLVTGAVDPDVLELDRMATVETGFRPPPRDLLRTLVYVSLQELATRVAHRNTGLASGDPVLDRLLARVAADENLHMVFYRSLVAEALVLAPSETLAAIAAEVADFAMPGTGIPGFVRRAALVARAGIYDLPIHREEVVAPLLAFWRVFSLTGLDADGEQARQRLAATLADLDRRAARTRRSPVPVGAA